jgi:hypothetical protein
MSVILECLLDDERRAECRANDGAMAVGRPIIASQPTIHPVQRTAGWILHGANIPARRRSLRMN